ncbi:hypothetical protein SDC9_134857 [bioreactor metagenome]|uniref:Uncharacterized protein n=1 Tax=bioreactor metagenome TaxID=1076179 RepID=A0A645DER2_9ZZZZ
MNGTDAPQRPPPAQGDALLVRLHGAARLPQRRRHGGQMALLRARQPHLAPRGCRRAEISSRGDAVGHHGVGAAVKLRAALYRNGGGSRAGNLCAAGTEIVLQILDLRLPRGVVNRGDAASAASRQHQIFRRANAWQAEHHLPPHKAGRGAAEPSAVLPDVGPQLPEARQM